MIRAFIIPVFFLSLLYLPFVSAEVETKLEKNKLELTKEELENKIGRIGETEEIPDGFAFSDAENRLWLSDHLKNITQPARLYYEFVKTGSYEEGFVDAVYLDILKVNDDGTKDAELEFFTGERKQVVQGYNVQNVVGNPVLGIYMQGDTYEMQRLTEGHWRHFHKQIKIALREVAAVTPTTITFNKKQLDAVKISFMPYIKDQHRAKFEQLADKLYEITLSDQVPGTLYQVRTIVLNKDHKLTEPLMEEVMTLVDIKNGKRKERKQH